MPNTTWIAAAARTPIGSLGGSLCLATAAELGAVCIKSVLERSGASVDLVDEVIMGNVVSAGTGQNPARQASIKAGLPPSVGATTINKVCGSGLKAVMLADQAIRLGEADLIVAGGMESMSLAPYLVPQARQGYRMGHGQLLDAMVQDGLWDIYAQMPMGCFGERCASKYGFSRAAQDEYAISSYKRACAAAAEGYFKNEIVPVEQQGRRGASSVSDDEEPARFQEEKLRRLRPAFMENGTVTAGNASSISDGAAAVLVASERKCSMLGLKPTARIVGAATYSGEPEWFTTAPVFALRKLMAKISWTVDDTDLFEINEAFASVAMAAQKELGIPLEKLNVHGGAIALGHPIGATGARILVTLLSALERTGGRRGIACLCIGGGEAVAMAVEIAR